MDRRGIEKLPPIVDKKVRFGDLEADTIDGKNHKGAVMAHNERISGAKDRRAGGVEQQM